MLNDVISNGAPPDAPQIPDPDTAVPDSGTLALYSQFSSKLGFQHLVQKQKRFFSLGTLIIAPSDLFTDVGDFTCEPDEYAVLVKNLRASGLIKDHRRFLLVQKNTFVGKEFVDWIVKTKGLGKLFLGHI